MNILEEGTRKEDLDAMVRFRLNFPMGICEMLDFVGIDTVYNANRELSNHGFGTAHSSILKEKVDSGKLGMKSGEGFYKYSAKKLILTSEDYS
ncbi:protein containing 3-hydroxyacyl-CoA dehydrogenase [mine drainage metagenome]|uniref:Protein containing 3-hydroxyacyl-CoA dehydrogenase n=1 Tax=mine drainage metagenome TaxID=410659 RepID=T0XZB6_9ZZZZ